MSSVESNPDPADSQGQQKATFKDWVLSAPVQAAIAMLMAITAVISGRTATGAISCFLAMLFTYQTVSSVQRQINRGP